MKTVFKSKRTSFGHWLCALWLLLIASPGAWAHKAGDAYLNLSGETSGALSLRLAVALRDWDSVDGTLDANGDRALTWAEVQAARERLDRRLKADLDVLCQTRRLPLDWQFEGLEERSDGVYTVHRAGSTCPDTASLGYAFRLLQGVDPTHRLLVAEQRRDRQSMTVIGAQAPARQASAGPDLLGTFVLEGMTHLLAGYDHIAFLLALVLPLSLARTGREKVARHASAIADAARRSAVSIGFAEVVLVVTCFTVGHSVTLILVTLWGLSIPSSLVEPAIALSIALSALMNLGWLVSWSRQGVAIGFGLIHGLGFSSSLQSLNEMAGASSLWALAGFNLGVEIGQLLLVVAWCLAVWLLDRLRIRRQWLVPVGSWCLIVVGVGLALARIASDT